MNSVSHSVAIPTGFAEGGLITVGDCTSSRGFNRREKDYRWIEERQALGPVENMARDAELLAEMIAGNECLPAVRIYQWAMPALSIGRLQNESVAQASYPDLPIVRRPTGGRAVVHGDDLTVTIATRDEWIPNCNRSVLSSYRTIISGIIDAFYQVGIVATFGPSQPGSRENDRADLRLPGRDRVNCFATVSSCDVSDTRTGSKILGSAQRRERGAILQQMSIAGSVVTALSATHGRGPQPLIDAIRDGLARRLNVAAWDSA